MKILILLGILGLGVSSNLILPQSGCMCPPGLPLCGSDWKTYFGECNMRCQNPGASILFQGPCAYPLSNYQQPNPYLLPNPFTNPSVPSYLSSNLPPSIAPVYPRYPNSFPSGIPYTTPALPLPYPTPSPSPVADEDEIDPLMAQRRSMSDIFTNTHNVAKVYDVIKKGIALVNQVKDVISVAAEDGSKDGLNKKVREGNEEVVTSEEDAKTGEVVTDAVILKDGEDIVDIKEAEEKISDNSKDADLKIAAEEAENKSEAQIAIEPKEVEK